MADGDTGKARRRGRVSPRAVPDTPDPVEIAMGEISGARPADEVARDLLRKHGGLIDDQRRHLRLQIASERVGLVLKGLTVVAGLAVATAVGLMAWEASRAQGVVISAFATPPDFAARGMTGQVLASHVQDTLMAMQAQTMSSRDSATYSSNWGEEIRLEIPQTGVSLGELQRLLRDWLGRERTVTGDLVHTPQGLRLTLRTEGAAHSADGPEADVDSLVARTSEALYGATQPYRYGAYLDRQGRFEEERAVYQQLALTSPPAEQAWAWIGLGNLAPTEAEARTAFERSSQLAPNLELPVNNLGSLFDRLGMAEQGFQTRQRALNLLQRRDRGGLSAEGLQQQRDYNRFRLGPSAARWSDAAEAVESLARRPNFSQSRAFGEAARAMLQTARHEYSAARRTLAALGADDAATPALRTARSGVAPYQTLAAATGDWAEVLAQVEAVKRLAAASPPHDRRAFLTAPLAAAEARALAGLGRLDEVESVIGTTPAHCYPCLISRAEIARARGDAASSERWYAAAAAAGPSLPQAHEAWARARLGRGDAAGALALARVAETRAPQWADPIEVAGEALLAQGDAKGAAKQFAAAARLAPRWGRLHLKWGEALVAAGDRQAAQTKWSAALGLDLSPADRERAQALMRTRS